VIRRKRGRCNSSDDRREDFPYDAHWQTTLHRLYQALLQPVEPHLKGCHRITLVPHGILHYLPFAALVVQPDKTAEAGGRVAQPECLLDRDWTIRTSPSATVLRYARGKWTGRLEKALILANADYAPWQWKPLRWAESEAAREVRGMRKNYAHPFYWAPFVFIGDWR
jgi:CHAT domain-containing protein